MARGGHRPNRSCRRPNQRCRPPNRRFWHPNRQLRRLFFTSPKNHYNIFISKSLFKWKTHKNTLNLFYSYCIGTAIKKYSTRYTRLGIKILTEHVFDDLVFWDMRTKLNLKGFLLLSFCTSWLGYITLDVGISI